MTAITAFGILLAISFISTVSAELYRGLKAEQ